MLNVATISTGLGTCHSLRGTGRHPVPARPRTTADEATRARLLAVYLEGWAEADPVKIADATVPEYRFDDPFVGAFSTLALPRYFAALRSRTGIGGLVGREHLGIVLRGPMDTPPGNGESQFWREAPHLGLTGTSLITVGPAGVTSERVAYDLNIASEQLRHPTEDFAEFQQNFSPPSSRGHDCGKQGGLRLERQGRTLTRRPLSSK